MSNSKDTRTSVLKRLIVSVLIISFMGAAPGALAVTLEWEPADMFFENIPVGETAWLTLTLTARDSPVSIESIEWTYNQPGFPSFEPQFAFVADRPVPATVLPDESMEIYISFTPEEAYTFASANLLVTNSSLNEAEFNYWIEGSAAEADTCGLLTDCSGTCTDLQIDVNNCGYCGNVCPVPANASSVCETGNCGFVCEAGFEPLDDECIPVSTTIVGLTNLLINYWYAGLEAPPTIIGFGPGESAEHRRDAIENMLLKAREFIFGGHYDLACGQLRVAYLKTDGGYPFVLPPDFVAGEGVAGLNERIEAVVTELDELRPEGCPLPEPITRVSE